MNRSQEVEIMDSVELSDDVVLRAHKDLDRVHRFLGNTTAILKALRTDPLPVKRVLDVGCGHGGMLIEVQRELGVEVVGVDLRPPKSLALPFPIIRADAVRDSLPETDVAISVCFAHHLSGDDLAAVIQNVGRSCRRFVILDLVRSRLPLVLFRTFVAPFLSTVNAVDGCISIRRAYTPDELVDVVRTALTGTAGTFRHSTSPLSIRQIADISY